MVEIGERLIPWHVMEICSAQGASDGCFAAGTLREIGS